jgi:hypothetical protein
LFRDKQCKEEWLSVCLHHLDSRRYSLSLFACYC